MCRRLYYALAATYKNVCRASPTSAPRRKSTDSAQKPQTLGPYAVTASSHLARNLARFLLYSRVKHDTTDPERGNMIRFAEYRAWNLTMIAARWLGKAGLVGLVFLVAFYASTLVWAAMTMNRWQ